jgi:DNA-binding beta-propeller fold protein YncE
MRPATPWQRPEIRKQKAESSNEMRQRLLLSALCFLLFTAEGPELRVTPVLLFNQHLYYGTFSRPRAIAVDPAHKEVWVADSGNNVVGIFRFDGAEVFAFAAKEQLIEPARIAIAPNGRVAIIEGNRTKLRIFNYRGRREHDLDLSAIGEKPVIGAITYDAAGNLYVADNRSSQIFVFAPDGKLRRQFGSRGSDEGQFQAVVAIRIAESGEVYVADQQALAVQVFDNQGNFRRGWGRHEMGADQFSLPSGLALFGDYVYVTDELRHQVKVFSTAGKFLTQFGGLGAGAGQLSFPTDVAVDAEGRLYVTERGNSRVQVFEIVVQ